MKNSQTKILIPEPTEQELSQQQSRDTNLDSAFYQQHRIKLGQEDIAVWGKRFLVKLTSKNTGKKIDINFNFRHVKSIREP